MESEGGHESTVSLTRKAGKKPLFLRYYRYTITKLIYKCNQLKEAFMDTMTPEQRSRTMSHIKSTDTKIEIALRKALWHKGYRYRKNYKALPGSPDIAITKYKIAIFCDSEFFHGYNWEIKKLYQ